MGFFTVGNLITLGIVALTLILYRQMDRNNRTLDKLSRHANELKKGLDTYVKERSDAIRNMGVDLDVERKAASELMKRLQKMTEEELAQKARAINEIDEKIKTYDVSLEELVKMTARVQENLGRIREESVFVENTGRRIGEVREQLGSMEKEIGSLELRFERENTEALEKAAETVMGTVKKTVAELAQRAEIMRGQAEEHRAAVDRAEKDRAANIARDTAIINKTLREAVEKAGLRADRMEEAALVKLREEAQERVRRLQTAFEEKLKAARENAQTRISEIQELLKNHRDEWKAEHGESEARRKQYRDEWKKDIGEFNAALAEQRREFEEVLALEKKELENAAAGQRESWNDMIKDLMASAAEAERRILESSDSSLEEYRQLAAEQHEQLAGLADDMAKLDGELRLSMDETAGRVRRDFERFEEESARERNRAAAEFGESTRKLKAGMEGLEQDLNALKNRAYENVSEKLKVFEDDFFADLTKRSGDIERRLAEWQETLRNRLDELALTADTERRGMELAITEDLRKNLAEQGDRLVAELERLKAETGAFEEGIREEMKAADETRRSFLDQLREDLAESRRAAEDSARAEIGRYALSAADTLKQHQRDVEEKLREIAEAAEARGEELAAAADASRRSLEDWQAASSAQIRDLDASMDDARRRIRDLSAESDEKTARIRAGLDDLKKDLSDQARLFEKSEDLKRELERRIEDLNGDLDRLDQRRNEAVQIENEFMRIKRLEEDINAKMTRILSEKHRIDVMETDFNRLLQTSQAVEEKLAQVYSSDDTLGAMQIQLRRLDDAIKETEEKYQRMERKNQTLEETNSGIDRNFRALQDSEAAVGKLNGAVSALEAEAANLRASIEILSSENEKAKETADKLTFLDESLTEIEKRIKDMQKAREWLAGMETRMEEINRQSQSKIRALGDILREEGPQPRDKGAPPPAIRENVITLAREGWTVDELANSFKISRGEVELILELGSLE
jgi:chromosome segregation ATPase